MHHSTSSHYASDIPVPGRVPPTTKTAAANIANVRIDLPGSRILLTRDVAITVSGTVDTVVSTNQVPGEPNSVGIYSAFLVRFGNGRVL